MSKDRLQAAIQDQRSAGDANIKNLPATLDKGGNRDPAVLDRHKPAGEDVIADIGLAGRNRVELAIADLMVIGHGIVP